MEEEVKIDVKKGYPLINKKEEKKKDWAQSIHRKLGVALF